MRAYGDIGGIVREKIAQFLKYCPRNKVIFTPAIDPCLKTLDVGYELANCIKNDLDSPHLPMIAEDCLYSLIKRAMMHDEVIGDYVAFANWGILFEPVLKFNLLSLLDSFSKSNTLILVDCGQADNECFHLVSKHFNNSVPLGKLTPFIIS